MIKIYTKYIAKGKLIVYTSIAISFLLRVLFLFFSTEEKQSSGGILWQLIEPYFRNKYISIVANTLIIAIIAFSVSLINKRYVLIRRRTSLPIAIAVLFLSCNSKFVFMSGECIAGCFLIFAVYILFSSYQNTTPQRFAFDVSIILGIGNLFAPFLLCYIPLFLVGFSMMKSLNFKSIIASALAVLMLYTLVACYFLLTNNFEIFKASFLIHSSEEIPFFHMSIPDLILTGIALLLLIVIIIDNSMNSFMDKIQIRAYISFMSLMTLTSLVACLLSSWGANIFHFVGVSTSILVLSHFFALANSKWKVCTFYILFTLFLFLTGSNFI